jgi:hypothetical protein
LLVICFIIKDNSGDESLLLLNEKPISKQTEEEIKHGDRLRLYHDTLLVLHMHSGLDTCLNCETSHILSKRAKPVEPAERIDKEKLRRAENIELKKKFGLERVDYQTKHQVHVKNDRNGQEDPLTDSGFSSKNVGKKLLQKMGWKEGDGLGKANQGIKEAVCSYFVQVFVIVQL